MARIRFRARFYVLLFILFIIIAGTAFYFLRSSTHAQMEMDVMYLSLGFKSVIIRDEQSVPAERYDKIIFDVAEGSRIENQTQVAQVFKWGYQEESMSALIEIQRQIQEHQTLLLEGIVKPELDTVEADIAKKQLEIRASVNGSSDKDLYELELEMKELLNRRMELLRDVQTDDTLTQLYSQEEAQLSNIASWKRDIINTAGQGIVSFYFDGYEQALNSQKLDMLSYDLLSRVLKGGAIEGSNTNSMESPLYRLINDEHFYIAFLTDSSAPFRLTQGETYTVVFEGYSSSPYTAVALAPFVSGTSIVNILEFHQSMGDLISVRVADINLMKDVSGISVPLEAIRNRDGVPGIMRVIGNDPEFVEVDVLAVDDERAIVKAKNENDILAPGQRYRR